MKFHLLIFFTTVLASVFVSMGVRLSDEYVPPKTSFGDPDLQGIWTNRSLTQLERNSSARGPTLTRKEEDMILARLKANHNTDTDFYELRATDARGVKELEIHGYDGIYGDQGYRFARIGGRIRAQWLTDPIEGMVPYNKKTLQFFKKRQYERLYSFDNPEDIWPSERCIIGFGSTSGPPMLNVLYNNFYQIVQSPGYVAILVEMNHDVRIIRLGGKHLPPEMRPWMGDSIGWWEGNTLVVETTNFNPAQGIAATKGQPVYVSPNSKVTEWFTRISNREIDYKFRVEDPEAYRQPWSAQMRFLAHPGPLYEYACQEGNLDVELILAGARYKERQNKGAGHVQRDSISLKSQVPPRLQSKSESD